MVWWVHSWHRFCSEAGKEPRDIAGNAHSMQLFLKGLDRAFERSGSESIVSELSTALGSLLSGGGSDGAELLKRLYSAYHDIQQA